MSYKGNTSNDPKTQPLSGGEPPPRKEGSIHVAGFRKLRPALRLSRNMISKRWYTFQLIESQIVHVVHQNPWPCFRSQNETVPSVSEVISTPPLERAIKSKDPETWQCFMPSGGSAQKRSRNTHQRFSSLLTLLVNLFVIQMVSMSSILTLKVLKFLFVAMNSDIMSIIKCSMEVTVVWQGHPPK